MAGLPAFAPDHRPRPAAVASPHEMDYVMVQQAMEAAMQVTVSEAKARLTELVRRAEAGEEIVLTRRGAPAVRLAPIARAMTPEERRAVIEDVCRRAAAKASPGPSAARSQDFLYGEDGMPA